MVNTLIGSCLYHYKSEPGLNRRIDFYELDDEKIVACVSRLRDSQWEPVIKLSEERIEVEAESQSEKVSRYIESINKETQMVFKENVQFSTLTLAEKKEIINQLGPKKTFKLSIFHEIGKDPKVELASRMIFSYSN